MTPTDHTSTLEEILGGFFPTTKHSGGKYLSNTKFSLRKFVLIFNHFIQQKKQSSGIFLDRINLIKSLKNLQRFNRIEICSKISLSLSLMSYEILLFHATTAKRERILHHWFAMVSLTSRFLLLEK